VTTRIAGNWREALVDADGGWSPKMAYLALDEGGSIGQVTSGDFSLSFQRGDGCGAGRSLEGRFSAVALDAGLGPEPLPPEGIAPLP
jgi:hypothetical protein